MKVGLLWFDDDPQRTIEEKVRQAAKRYREKLGGPPTLATSTPSACREMAARKMDFVAAW